MTKAVMVQTTTVSIKGSSKATMPSRTGYSVLAAECAIAAEPIPASFEKAARLKPTTKIPMNPPSPASKESALEKILPMAAGTSPALMTRM